MNATDAKPISETPPADPKLTGEAAADPLREVQQAVDEIRESVGAFARVSVDSIAASVRRVAVKAVILVAAAMLAAITMIIGVVFALDGLAEAAAAAFRAPEWVGRIVVGVLAVGVPIIALRIRAAASSRERVRELKERYANDASE